MQNLNDIINRLPELLEQEQRHRERVAADLIERCKPIAARAIGMPFTIRISRNTTFSGVIVKCEVSGTRQRARSVCARFKVTLRGTSGQLREYTVERVPNPR
jgi:hypothetical protein